MKLKSYRFKSYEEIAEVASSVLTYYTSTICPSDIKYNPIADYKNIQLFKLLDGRYDITPEDLMQYLSCPIGLEDPKDINSNFGLRVKDVLPSNGTINTHLSKMILVNALLAHVSDKNDYLIDSIIDFELDEEPEKREVLPSKDELLDYYVQGMLPDTDLLYYLFLTGNGKKFTEEFGDIEFLKQLETKTFKEADIYDRVHEAKKGHSKASVKLLRCYNEDIEKIKDIMKEELVVVNDIQVPEKVFK